MFIPRSLSPEIKEKLKLGNKAIILYGARQVGKTTLVKKLLENLPYKILSINADEQKYIDILSSKDFAKLKSLVSGYNLVFIDEAQRIPDIGLNLKIIIDQMPDLKIIVTGSSSFDFTGRAWTYTLFPISFSELSGLYNPFELTSQLEERLIFGSYPEIFSFANNQTKREYLEQISNAYLFKDIFEFAHIKHTSKIRDLVKLIAFQIGNEVSMAELAASLEMSKATVESYIDLLEKAFVIFRLHGFSRNLRKEVTKMDKIYFFDLGIRNIVIDNVKFLKDRNDTGALWENFLIAERMKFLHYEKKLATQYFWRTYTGAELDYVEEIEGKLIGCEFKYGAKKTKAPKSWMRTYPEADFQNISRENFLTFLL